MAVTSQVNQPGHHTAAIKPPQTLQQTALGALSRADVDLSFGWYTHSYFSLSLSSTECAKAFHAAGSRLVLCGRDSEKLKELVQELCAVKNHRKKVSVAPGQAPGLTWPGFLL